MAYKLAFFSNFSGARDKDLSSVYLDAVSGRSINWSGTKRFTEFSEVVFQYYPRLKDCDDRQLKVSPWNEEVVFLPDNGVLIASFCYSEAGDKAFEHILRSARGFQMLVYDPQKNHDPLEPDSERFYASVKKGLTDKSHDDIEGLRDDCRARHAERLTGLYLKQKDWLHKDMLIQLVQDEHSDGFATILLDAINSPSPYSKIASISYRKNDKSVWDSYFEKGVLLNELVEKDAQQFK